MNAPAAIFAGIAGKVGGGDAQARAKRKSKAYNNERYQGWIALESGVVDVVYTVFGVVSPWIGADMVAVRAADPRIPDTHV